MPDASHPSGEAHDGGKLIGFPRGSGSNPPPENNLPLQLTSFIGRDREISDLKHLLTTEARLLTLTGPGGSGKTRLALAAASAVAGHFEDGVWWVELAPLSDEHLVPQAVASVLRVQESPGRSLTGVLAEDLRDLEVLLVLDNCEHVVGACAELAYVLLRSSPGLRILTTSREALGIEGETHFAVPPLSSPGPHGTPLIEELERIESVRLFVERARYKVPGFALGPENASSVAEVCSRLDGIPLAIELAAARVGALSVEQISGRIGRSLGLLSAGNRTSPERQRTLRGALDWSFDLLDEHESEVFGRLSVFAGGFTLDAAEAVCVGGRVEPEEVLDLLARLVEKSLVLATERKGEARYRLLETIRQYALEKLRGSGEEPEARRRHADCFFGLVEEAEPQLKGRGQVIWLERLETEHDNLRAAIRWLLQEGEAETVARLVWALWYFWYLRGHQSEGYRYTREALENKDELPVGPRAKALCILAVMAYGRDSAQDSGELFEESEPLFRQVGDKPGLAIALGGQGASALQQGDIGRATGLLEECIEVYRELGDKWGMSETLVYQGLVPLATGDYERARGYFEEALALSQELGNRHSGYLALHNLALMAQGEGDREQAVRLYAEGLRMAVEVGDRADIAYCLEGLAELAGERGEPYRAARLFGASEALLETVGTPLYAYASDRHSVEQAVSTLRSRLDEENFAAAWSEGRAMTQAEIIEYALATEQAHTSDEETPSSPLSTREAEILVLVAEGLTNPQIAEKLYLSPRTVGQHLRSIYRKLGVSSRAAATTFAVEQGIL